MIATIHQPEYLPWLGFFNKMSQADVFVLLDTVQFAKDDFQNRNRIKTQSGPTWLTVPVYKNGASQQLIRDVRICNDRCWGRRCWSLLNENYRRAPHFASYKPFFEELYGRDWSRLVDLNLTIIRYLAREFRFKAELVTASELGVYERGTTEVNLGICRRLGADVYLSGVCGKDYLDVTRFANHNIEVRFQSFVHPVYPQLWGEFLPRMSAIDLLFNCGSSSTVITEQGDFQPMQAPAH